ncbi:hypothetical protein [Mycobacterium marinum]|uniref:hypothetical protein n=1 Tax=Mycobacterium marinum TaxID=1781 RepID=UPI002358A08C|nr:hypothetical protein [Mycobacterium marinum]MDC9004090.1 hypothetical protein [Mycobacterium marinum]
MFKDYDPLRETHQQLNHALRHATVYVDGKATHPPLVADFSQIDAQAEKLANVALARFGPLDDHPDARGKALKAIYRYRDSLKAAPDGLFAERANIVGDPDTGLYVLLAYDPTHAIAVSEPSEWKSVASKYLPRFHRSCDMQITIGCTQSNATLIEPVKVGEFIVVFRCCQQCRDFFDEPVQMRENLERGGWDDDWDRR